MRIALIDGGWFDAASAKEFSEGTAWDGSNHVSLCAGGHDHQSLYRTKGGSWILCCWSQWQGCPCTYQRIDRDTAARWFVRNEYQSVPAELTELVDAMEV